MTMVGFHANVSGTSNATVIAAGAWSVWLAAGSLVCPVRWQRLRKLLYAEAMYCTMCSAPCPAQKSCCTAQHLLLKPKPVVRRLACLQRWTLPGRCRRTGTRPACCRRQLSDKSPQAVNKATHKSWAREFGVICLGGASTFFTIDGADEPQFWPPDELRTALTPSGAAPGCPMPVREPRPDSWVASPATWRVRAVDVLLEACQRRGDLVPVVSQGTHFTPARTCHCA